jgi:hypothetical protein
MPKRPGVIFVVSLAAALLAVLLAGSSAAGSARVPKNVVAPRVRGEAVVGQRLLASHGRWRRRPRRYRYAWQRCAGTGTRCAFIPRARGRTYRIRTSDVGRRLRVSVTASNAAGSASARSRPTRIVSQGGSPPPPPPPPSAPCAGTGAPARYAHVVWILFENHAYSSIIGSSSAPYFNQLASLCGLATNYSAITHPSLPNYIALTSGSTQGITDDGSPSQHPLAVPSIFSQLPGGASRSVEESMPANCALNNSGRYVARHNPEVYYTNIRTDCGTYDVPLVSPANISARFTFVTPDLCSDMHDCSVATGDTWLSHFLPPVLASSEYRAGNTAIFITFDEGSGGHNQVATLVVAPPVRPGARSAAAYTHYSLLRTTEEMLGLGLLGNAASAPSMRAGLGL